MKKALTIVILLFVGFAAGLNVGFCQSSTSIYRMKGSIDAKRKSAKQKINILKIKEKKELNKLNTNKKTLQYTTQKLQTNKQQLNYTQQKLSGLKQNIRGLEEEYYDSQSAAAKRLTSLYKGERLSVLNLIFSAKDLNTFLDRIYYQKRISECDKNLLEGIEAQQRQMVYKKRLTEYQKSNIIGSINFIRSKQYEISKSIEASETRVKKLRMDRLEYERAEQELASQSANLARMLSEASNSADSGFIRAAGIFLRPVAGAITSPFGWRVHPIFRSRKFHTGVDIAGRNGSPIRAANNGVVLYSGWYGGYGKVVIINHGSYNGSPTTTLYAHLSSIMAQKGDKIRKGEVIGREGTTGYSTGPHLHFEVRLNGRPANPLAFIGR